MDISKFKPRIISHGEQKVGEISGGEISVKTPDTGVLCDDAKKIKKLLARAELGQKCIDMEKARDEADRKRGEEIRLKEAEEKNRRLQELERELQEREARAQAAAQATATCTPQPPPVRAATPATEPAPAEERIVIRERAWDFYFWRGMKVFGAIILLAIGIMILLALYDYLSASKTNNASVSQPPVIQNVNIPAQQPAQPTPSTQSSSNTSSSNTTTTMTTTRTKIIGEKVVPKKKVDLEDVEKESIKEVLEDL